MDDTDTSATPVTNEELADLLHARIQALLRVVQLESDGEPIEPTGFRFSARDVQCGS